MRTGARLTSYNSLAMTKFRALHAETFYASDGTGIVLEDFGGTGDNLLFVHATGFSARMYLPIAGELRHRFHCWGLNARFHGGSGGNFPEDLPWRVLSKDIQEAVRRIGGGAWHGFGHSYGGAGLLLAEQEQPGMFGSLFLYEPVVIGPAQPEPDEETSLAVLTRKRRQTFTTRAEAAANFASKPPMNTFDPRAIDLYLETGWTRGFDGHIHLACPREIEAEVYTQAICHDAWDRMERVKARSLMVAGGRTDSFSFEHIAQLAARSQAAEPAVAEGLGHFGPFEVPSQVAKMAEAFLG